jgi:hypothetical protein
MTNKRVHRSSTRRTQSGTSLIEVTVALTILLIASVGVMGIASVSMITTENQGHLVARASEYAQDKMEQLISLSYGDSTSDTTVFPTVSSGGTGLAIGGSSDPDGPAAGYVDYLDYSGNPLPIVGGAAPADWYYIRVWEIATPGGTTNLKQITVSSKVRRGAGKPGGSLPRATMTALKTNPF